MRLAVRKQTLAECNFFSCKCVVCDGDLRASLSTAKVRFTCTEKHTRLVQLETFRYTLVDVEFQLELVTRNFLVFGTMLLRKTFTSNNFLPAC